MFLALFFYVPIFGGRMPGTETGKKYKIKITPERTLGPLDLDRVRALVNKGRITGQEPTSIAPFTDWQPFTSFRELSEMLLQKMESDQSLKQPRPEPKSTQESAPTRTIISTEKTKTLPALSNEVEKEDEGSFGIPTLVDIQAPPPVENPDLEKTEFALVVAAPREVDGEPVTEGGTKILNMEKMENALAPFKAPDPAIVAPKGALGLPTKGVFGKALNPEDYVTETGKRRLLSRNTAALLALLLLFLGWLSVQQEEEEDPANISPRYHTFPYVEVNFPPRLGDRPDLALSATLVEKGQTLIEQESPSAYMRAIKSYFYTAVGRNPASWDARALLASSYMRISEIIPRDKRLYETIDKLLMPGPPSNIWTPEYAVARAEYYQLLNRLDQAQEIIDAYVKVRPTFEVLYQKAKISYDRREIDSALAAISRAIPPEKVGKANPRHLLLWAMLLEKKGQREASLQAVKRMTKESPNYGPGILYYADLQSRNGKPAEARKILKYLLARPYLLDRMQLADAFVLTAKVLEALNDMPRALRFANAANRIHYNREVVEDLLFRVKSRMPATKVAYSQVVSARQKEKAKQIDLAINHYIRALEANRKDPTAFLLLANLYEQKGDIYEAIDRYSKALRETPQKPIEAALELGRIYANRYQLQDAKGMMQTAAQMGEQKDRVDFLRGLIQLRSRRQDLAEPHFESAIRKGSRLPELYIQVGDLEAERKNEKLAEFYYSTALRYEPFHPKAMLGVALTRFHLDSPSRAISFLKDKLATQPNSAAIMTNLAIIYLRSGDQDSGKNYLQNAIRSDSKYAEAFRLLGDLTKDEGNRQADNFNARRHSYRYALASYEMYSKLAPNDPEGYKATGDLYFDIRDLGAAAKNYHKVLELTPNYPDVRLRLAQISRNGGDADRAMKFLEEEIKINPRSDAALVEKGRIYMAKKDFQAATNAFTAAARINEKNADALFGLGVVYHLQGSYDNALSLFDRVVKLDPLMADVYWQQGLIYQKLSNRARATQAFTNYKGIVRDPAAVSKADEKIRELSR